MRELFTGDNGKLSSKRIIGSILIGIAMFLLIDSHFSDRDLNNDAFSSMMYTGGIMIVGGVLENQLGGRSRNGRSGLRRPLNEREGHYGRESEED